MKKRVISVILAFMMILTLIPMAVTAEDTNEPQIKIGEPLGDILYSDIVGFIDGYAIPTDIKSGTTMVVVEDLAKYGFDVVWNKSDKSLKVERNMGKTFKPLTVEKDTTNKPGTFKCKYVYTDIKTYISGDLIESFAINGVTLIDFELLVRYGKLNWNGATKEIKLTLNKPAPPPAPKPEPEKEIVSDISDNYKFLVIDEQAKWDIFMAQNVYNLGNGSTYLKQKDNFTWVKFEPVLKSFTQKFGKNVAYKAPLNKDSNITKGEVISYLYEIITSALKIKNPEAAVDYFAKNGLINAKEKGDYPIDETCAGNEMIVLSVRVYEHICYKLGLDSKGFFWKVTGEKNTVYLLGSIHLSDGSLYPLNKAIETAFDSAKYLAVEIDFNAETEKENNYIYEKGFIPISDNRTIADYIAPEIYEVYVEICKIFEIDESFYNKIYPWFAELILTQIAMGMMVSDNAETIDEVYDSFSNASSLGIDNHFTDKAKAYGKKIIGLESSKMQIDMMASYSRELQEALLVGALIEIINLFEGAVKQQDKNSEKSLFEMLTMWKSGDEKALMKMNGIDETINDPLAAEYNYKLLTERNINMFNKIKGFLTKGDGDYFVIVGAAHMLGKQGIVQLLIDAGYKVERVK